MTFAALSGWDIAGWGGPSWDRRIYEWKCLRCGTEFPASEPVMMIGHEVLCWREKGRPQASPRDTEPQDRPGVSRDED